MMSIKKFWQDNRFTLVVFLIWRLGLFLFEFLGMAFLSFKEFAFYETLTLHGLPQWLWQWGNFDGVHYLTLAKMNYDGFGNQVFFPLYPLLIYLASYLLSPIVAGLLISNLAILLAALLFYRMTKNKWAIIFFFAFPTSFFFGTIYTESLFLLLVLLTYTVSKLFAVPAGATRLVGSFLHPLAWLGLIAYSFYLGMRFGKPLFFLSAQSAFSNGRASSFSSLVNPAQVVFRYLKIFTTVSPSHYDYWVAILEFMSFVLILGLLIWMTIKRKYPITWLIFSWAALLLPVFSGTLSSMPRYVLVIFPVYIALGSLKSKPLKLAILAVFVVLLGLLTALFTRGYWVS